MARGGKLARAGWNFNDRRMTAAIPGIVAVWAFISIATAPLHAQTKPPEVTVSKPVHETIPLWDEFTGQFEALRKVDVRARVAGQLVEIHFVDGQTVKTGDVLFTIDPKPFEIAVDVAKAEVARVKAQQAVAAKELERAGQLAQKQFATQQQLDQRNADYSVTVAQLQSAEASLRNAALNLDWTVVRAPIGGRVSDRKVDAGNLVSGGQVASSLLATIVNLDPIHFVFNVPESEFTRYSRISASGLDSPSDSSKAVQIRLPDEKDWHRNGRLDFVDNQFNGKSGTIRLRAILDNKDGILVPGTFARLRLSGGEADALLIPDAAVSSDQSRKIVYVIGPENKIQAKPVVLGPIARSLRVVTAGLSKDDLVVIAGFANPAVRPGAVVSPTRGEIKLAAN
jgi:RND family efflux transporter MFP subunit